MPPGLSTQQPVVPGGGNTGMATVPPSNAGAARGAMVFANLGMSMLLKAAEMFPAGSKERLVVLEMITKGEKTFQGASKDLSQQAAKLVSSQANPTPTASPEQQLAMSKMQSQDRLAQMAPAMGGGA